jgi:Fe-S-cluster containining protein
MKNTHELFYEKGLQFECLKCGRCCTGFPGYVYLSEADVEGLARFLHLDNGVFMKKYTRLVHVFNEPRLSLVEKARSLVEKARFDCVFWDGECTVYPARPHQCRTYPFWKRHLISEREWNKLAGFCPGINRGKVYTKEDIQKISAKKPDYNLHRFAPGLLSAGLLSAGLLSAGLRSAGLRSAGFRSAGALPTGLPHSGS